MAKVNTNINAVAKRKIPFEKKRKTSNADSMSFISEYCDMKNNPSEYRRYNNFDELFKDVIESEI